MTKIEEATQRLFKNIFICRNCKSKMRASSIKVSDRLISCRKCGYKILRAKKRK